MIKIICVLFSIAYIAYFVYYIFIRKEDESMYLKIKKLNDNATIPTRGSEYAAGLDLYSADSQTIINPGETKIIGTGLSMEPPEKTFIAIVARSGLSVKQGLAPANKFGVVDEDYRGEVKVALYNQSSEPRAINYGDRIAQAIVIPYIPCEPLEVDELSNTDRGEGGFGSTGK